MKNATKGVVSITFHGANDLPTAKDDTKFYIKFSLFHATEALNTPRKTRSRARSSLMLNAGASVNSALFTQAGLDPLGQESYNLEISWEMRTVNLRCLLFKHDSAGVDAVLIGECEIALSELVKSKGVEEIPRKLHRLATMATEAPLPTRVFKGALDLSIVYNCCKVVLRVVSLQAVDLKKNSPAWLGALEKDGIVHKLLEAKSVDDTCAWTQKDLEPLRFNICKGESLYFHMKIPGAVMKDAELYGTSEILLDELRQASTAREHMKLADASSDRRHPIKDEGGHVVGYLLIRTEFSSAAFEQSPLPSPSGPAGAFSAGRPPLVQTEVGRPDLQEADEAVGAENVKSATSSEEDALAEFVCIEEEAESVAAACTEEALMVARDTAEKLEQEVQAVKQAQHRAAVEQVEQGQLPRAVEAKRVLQEEAEENNMHLEEAEEDNVHLEKAEEQVAKLARTLELVKLQEDIAASERRQVEKEVNNKLWLEKVAAEEASMRMLRRRQVAAWKKAAQDAVDAKRETARQNKRARIIVLFVMPSLVLLLLLWFGLSSPRQAADALLKVGKDGYPNPDPANEMWPVADQSTAEQQQTVGHAVVAPPMGAVQGVSEQQESMTEAAGEALSALEGVLVHRVSEQQNLIRELRAQRTAAHDAEVSEEKVEKRKLLDVKIEAAEAELAEVLDLVEHLQPKTWPNVNEAVMATALLLVLPNLLLLRHLNMVRTREAKQLQVLKLQKEVLEREAKLMQIALVDLDGQLKKEQNDDLQLEEISGSFFSFSSMFSLSWLRPSNCKLP